MKGFCEAGCGGRILVAGNKWCPECAKAFSYSHSALEKAFVVVAGKYETIIDEEGYPEQCENIKFASEPMLLDAAERTLEEYKGYHFARIEHVEVKE